MLTPPCPVPPVDDVEWNGICACGKTASDGVRCRLGATHETLAMSRARDMLRNPHLYPAVPPCPVPPA